MRKKMGQLIALTLSCVLFLGGCTSPKEAEQQMNMDFKSAAYLLQFSGIAAIMQYRLNLSDSEVTALPSKISLAEESFQKQVQKGRDHLVKNAEILLEAQENVLPNVLIYVTSLPALGVTQRHLEDDIFEKYRTANVSYYSCFNRANQTGTRTNFKSLETTIQQGNLALADANKTLEKVQGAVDSFISGYAESHQGFGWNSAMKKNQESWDWLTAANRVISACSEMMDENIQLAKGYYLCEAAVYQLGAAGFSPDTISTVRNLLTTVNTALTELNGLQSEIKEQAAILQVDASAFEKVLVHMKTFADNTSSLLDEMERYNTDKNAEPVSLALNPFTESYQTLSAGCEQVVLIINSCTQQMMTKIP